MGWLHGTNSHRTDVTRHGHTKQYGRIISLIEVCTENIPKLILNWFVRQRILQVQNRCTDGIVRVEVQTDVRFDPSSISIELEIWRLLQIFVSIFLRYHISEFSNKMIFYWFFIYFLFLIWLFLILVLYFFNFIATECLFFSSTEFLDFKNLQWNCCFFNGIWFLNGQWSVGQWPRKSEKLRRFFNMARSL